MAFSNDAYSWACVPASTMTSRLCRENSSTARITRALRAENFKLPRSNYSSSSLISSQCHKYNSISSRLFSSLQFFDKSSATSTISTNDKNSFPKRDNTDPVNDTFFIRPALLVDMDRASKILADGFFKGPKTNWFTYQYEKFITYLSLEANFPKTQQQRSRYEILVACCVKTGEVWGLVEIDARGTTIERTSKVYEQSGGSPYMCNLAVDEKCQRKGECVYEICRALSSKSISAFGQI